MAITFDPGKSLVFYLLLVATYLSLNSLLNLTNKFVLSSGPSPSGRHASGTGYGFSFPILLTCCHMAFSFVALLPYMLTDKMRHCHGPLLEKQWKGIMAIGVFMAANIALNNSSLVDMTLSLNQIIRSSIPTVTAIVAVFVERQIPGRGEAGALLLLTGGVMLAVWEGAARGAPWAILLCFAGTVSNAAMMSVSGRVLSERVEVLAMTFYTAPVSLAVLFPVFLVRESARLGKYMALHDLDVYGILVVSSTIALSYNLVHSFMIKYTTAVATTVIGQLKIVGLMVLSYFVLGEKKVFTFNMTLGAATALVGFALYSWCKLQALEARRRQADAVVELALANDEEQPLVEQRAAAKSGAAGLPPRPAHAADGLRIVAGPEPKGPSHRAKVAPD